MIVTKPWWSDCEACGSTVYVTTAAVQHQDDVDYVYAYVGDLGVCGSCGARYVVDGDEDGADIYIVELLPNAA